MSNQKERKSSIEIDSLKLLSILQENIGMMAELQKKHTWRSGSLWREHLRSDLRGLIKLCETCLEIIK
jgi:hypothetical protein